MTNKNHKEIIVNDQKFNSIASAADAFGMPHNTVRYRLSKGWTPEQAVGLKPRPSSAGSTAGIPVKVQGLEFSSIRQAAKHFGRAYTHIFDRLKEGCTIEQALGLIERTDSLQTEYPDLAKQWHPNKNAPLTPDATAPHSGKKVWWICQKGHEWKAVINSRTRGHGCPYCAGQKPTARRNFATIYPEVAKEWDLEKNKNCQPENYAPRSKYKVWWRCEKGHSWQTSISNRTREYGGGCPYCSSQKINLTLDNCLSTIRPDIAKEWHPNKNAPLTPNDVTIHDSDKVWWICKHGHEWEAETNRRVNRGSGCPKCSNQTSMIEIAVYSELYALFDDVIWRKKKAGYECDVYLQNNNIGIEIDGFYWHSQNPERELAKSNAFKSGGVLLFRLRENGLKQLSDRDVFFKSSDDKFLIVSSLIRSLLKHAVVSNKQQNKLQEYLKGPGLINEKFYRKLIANLPAPPLDQSLAVEQPDLIKEWAYDLNSPLLPEHFKCGSIKKIWWCCSKGHTWKTSIRMRTERGSGCPACAGHVATDEKNLAVIYPKLAKEWHFIKNGTLRPEDILPKSNQKIWWICRKGHEWQAQPAARAKGSGCPYCYGRYATKKNNLASKYPEILKEWDYDKNKGLNPSNITPHNPKKVWWKCAKGHSWQAIISNRTRLKSGCPDCFKALPKPQKYTIDDMKKIAEAKRGKCLSKEYHGLRVKLRWQCKKGHEWKAIPDQLLYKKTWCPVCLGRNQNIADMNKLASKRGGKCLSSKYFGSKTKLSWQCKKGHTWEATPNNIKNHGKWCPVCGGNKKLTLEDMQKMAEDRKGKCLSSEYVNVKSKLKWQCAEGHTWEATPDSIKNSGTWCPYCAGRRRLDLL